MLGSGAVVDREDDFLFFRLGVRVLYLLEKFRFFVDVLKYIYINKMYNYFKNY